MSDQKPTRRNFLATTVLGGLAAKLAGAPHPTLAATLSAGPGQPGRVSAGEPTASAPQKDGRPAAEPTAPMPIRGLMADAARLQELPAYYRRLIDFSQEWKLNTLLLSLTDDQGCAFRFQSHPELITHRHALTHGEASQLARYGQERGVQIIPLIESFGHSRFITGVPRYAHLADRNPQEHRSFNALIPVAPESLRIISDLYREAAAAFPSPYLHGGCDEVAWGGAPASQEALKTRTRAQIWAEYLNALDGVARELGKQFIVWGDHVLRKEPEILGLLDKDVIIMDWDYQEPDPKVLAAVARKALDAGFRVLGAPALIWCGWGPRPGRTQCYNMDAYADAYRGITDSRCLGAIVTNWIPSRYLQRSIWDGLAYGAVALNEGSETARRLAFRRFVETFYGAKWDAVWSDVFETYWDIAPHRRNCARHWLRPVLVLPWSNPRELAAAAKAGPANSPPFARLRRQLGQCAPRVRRNPGDFRSFELSVEYLEHVYWRNSVVARETSRAAAASLIREIARRDRELLAALDAEWNQRRSADSEAKSGPVYNLGHADQLLYTFRRATEFAQQLARNPQSFVEALKSGESG